MVDIGALSQQKLDHRFAGTSNRHHQSGVPFANAGFDSRHGLDISAGVDSADARLK